MTEVIAKRGRDRAADRRRIARLPGGPQASGQARQAPERVHRERPVGGRDLLWNEGDEVVGVHEQPAGRIHPAVPIRCRLEVDGEAIAVRDQEIRAERLARLEDRTQRGLHLRRFKDLASDDRLRHADALAPAGPQAVRVERDPC